MGKVYLVANTIWIGPKFCFFIVIQFDYLNARVGFYRNDINIIVGEIFFDDKISDKYRLINFNV